MTYQKMSFPNPMDFGKTLNKVFLEILVHPQKPVLYQVRNSLTKENVLFGIGKCAYKRMGSLLPKENGGRGTRNNNDKRQYCWENIQKHKVGQRKQSRGLRPHRGAELHYGCFLELPE